MPFFLRFHQPQPPHCPGFVLPRCRLVAARRLGEQIQRLAEQNEIKEVKKRLQEIYSKDEYSQLTDGLTDEDGEPSDLIKTWSLMFSVATSIRPWIRSV